MSPPADDILIEGTDYYVDPDGLWVFTAAYLKQRGFCCKKRCRHCPYTDWAKQPPAAKNLEKSE